MEATDDSPQIGAIDVDADAIDAGGKALSELLDEFNAQLDPNSATDAPTEGWRILKQHPGGSTLFGVPADPDRKTWRLAQLRREPESSDAVLFVHPDAERLRPSRATRRRGLELRWPSMLIERAWSGGFAIDIVNSGSTRWLPDGDAFQVVGVLTEPGVAEFSFGWAGMGQDSAVPLEPGEYARVPVSIGQAPWATLSPGRYDLHAVLVGLGLRATRPLSIDLSAETIAKHRDRANRGRPTRDVRLRSTDEQIEGLRTQLRAGRALPAIAESVAAAETDDDAAVRIAALLDCDAVAARSVYHSPLRQLRPGNAVWIERQLEHLSRQRDELIAQGTD